MILKKSVFNSHLLESISLQSMWDKVCRPPEENPSDECSILGMDNIYTLIYLSMFF